MKKTLRLTSLLTHQWLIQRTDWHRRFLFTGLILVAGLALYAAPWRKAQNAQAVAAFATITVTGTADGTLASLAGNGTCDLREAIQAANTNAAVGECTAGAAGLDTIIFNLPGPGYTINVAAGGLQAITQAVVIEGAPFAGSPDRVELNGASAGSNIDGLRITAGSSTIRGLVINRFTGDGIELNGSSGNIIEGCYVGTDAGGTLDQGNEQSGVNVVASTNNRIGGAAAAARNVISGNNGNGVYIDFGVNTVQGNYIGTEKDGELALGNSGDGIHINTNPGPATTILNNLISSNGGNGIRAFTPSTSATIVRGNLIGTDKDGDTDLGNSGDGVFFTSGTGGIIGGTIPAERNVISGNSGNGLVILGGAGAQVIVQGNYIGTNAAGTAALGNSRNGIDVPGDITIGGTTGTTPGGNCTGACNLVSGNGQNGILSRGNTLVAGNYIGTDVTGNVDLGNTQSGVMLFPSSSLTPSGLTVGGTTPESRNLISGNNQYGILLERGGATVQGNIIGLNVTGTNDLGNSKAGVSITTADNLVGGTTAGAGNVISGNDEDGICACAGLLSPGSTNTIQGNLIGTDATGTLDRGNTRDGIRMITSFLLIGGATPGARNIVSGNNGVGISSVYPSVGPVMSITIQGNYVGTDINGTSPLGNTFSGVYLIGGQDSLVGGTAAGEGNVIAANTTGIYLDPGTVNGPTIQGNLIGTDKTGTLDLGNTASGIRVGQSNTTVGGVTASARNLIVYNKQKGIELVNSSSNTSIKGNYIGSNTLNGIQAMQTNTITIGGTAAGEGNTITGNGENGVQVRIGADKMAIRGNAVYGNTKLGIDLAPTLPGGTVTPNDTLDDDAGPNRLQNFPVLDAITQPCNVTGSLNSSTTSTAYPVRIDFYASTACDAAGNGEGEVYLGSLPSPLTAPGSFSFSFTPVAGKPVITATATDANGNTSEFSACQTAPVNQAPVIAPASITRVEGQPGANSTIANITDTNQASNTLTITINGQPISSSPTVTVNGVTISNLAITPAGALTADVVAACGATSASFTLTATDNCGVTTTGSLAVTVTPAPAPMASAGLDQALCSMGATTTFTLVGNAANGAAAWSVVSGPVSITNPGALNSTAVFTGAGTATLRLTVTGSCNTATDEVVLTVNPSPSADAGPDRTLTCATTSVTLNGSSTSLGATFSWSGPGGFTSNTATPVVSAAGAYMLIVTSAAGCTASDTVTVTSDVAAPNAEAGADKTLTCSTTSVTLDGSSTTPGAIFSWSGPGGFTSNAAAPTVSAAGPYTLTVTNPANDCTASDTVTVTANTAVPDATLTVVSEVCASAAGIVASVPDAGPGAAYGWTLTNGTVTSGGGTHSITFTAGTSGSVSITVGVQGANDCFTSSSKTVTIKPASAVTVPPANQAVCAGNSAPVSFAVTAAGVNLSYAWTLDGNATGGNAANTTIDPSSLPVGPHTVSVTVTGDCGAPVTASATLTINVNPSAVITAPATVCSTSSGNAASAPDAGAGASYSWTITNGTITAGAGTQQITWTAGASGTATLNITVTNANGCSGSASNNVTINPAISFIPTTLSDGTIGLPYGPTSFTAAGGSGSITFSVLPGSLPNGMSLVSGQLSGTPTQQGSFPTTVTATDGVCSASRNYTLVVNCPTIIINPSTIPVAQLNTAYPAQTFTASAGNGPYTFSQSGTLPAGMSFTGATLSGTPTEHGDFPFAINVTDQYGCTASRSFTLKVNRKPVAKCKNVTVAAGPGGTAAASIDDGSSDPDGNTITLTQSPAGPYPIGTTSVTLTVADDRGASSSCTATVTVIGATQGLGGFVVFSREHTFLRANTQVFSGNVGANTSLPDPNGGADDKEEVEIGLGVKMLQAGSKVVGDTVRLRANSQIYDVHFNEEFFGPDATILGNQVTPQTLPVFVNLPALPAIIPGGTDIVVSANQTMTLAAGAYRNITVNHDATLILTGGIYHLEKLDIRQDAKLHFTAPAEVRIKNEMDTDSDTYIGPAPSAPSLQASQIIFYCEGADDGGDLAATVVQIGIRNTVKANFYAPNGTVYLRANTVATGAFIGKQAQIGERVVLNLKSAF